MHKFFLFFFLFFCLLVCLNRTLLYTVLGCISKNPAIKKKNPCQKALSRVMSTLESVYKLVLGVESSLL